MNQADPKNPRPPIKAEIVDESKSDRIDPTSMLMNAVIAIVCAIYIINPGAGFIEFIPDNLPFIGNLDEATATAGLLYALSGLGAIPWTRKK